MNAVLRTAVFMVSSARASQPSPGRCFDRAAWGQPSPGSYICSTLVVQGAPCGAPCRGDAINARGRLFAAA